MIVTGNNLYPKEKNGQEVLLDLPFSGFCLCIGLNQAKRHFIGELGSSQDILWGIHIFSNLFYLINPFLFINEKRRDISSKGFSDLKHGNSSEGKGARDAGEKPLFVFATGVINLGLHFRGKFKFKKERAKWPLLSAAGADTSLGLSRPAQI